MGPVMFEAVDSHQPQARNPLILDSAVGRAMTIRHGQCG